MSKQHMLFAFLRFLSIFLVLLLLINPKFEQLNTVTEKPKLLVVTDNSESVVHLEQDANARKVRSFFKTDTDLNASFDIQYYTFGNVLQQNDSLTFSSKQTDISKAFSDLNTIHGQDVAPIVLITDGNQTFGDDYTFTTVKQPVYPIILGDTTTYLDLHIKQLQVNKYAYLNNKFPVETILVYTGNRPVTSTFTVKSGSHIVFSKTVQFSKHNNSEVLQFTLPASRVGVTTYEAELAPLPQERNTINNRKSFAVEVIDEQMNVALVSNFYHPDLGMFKKSIESNKQRSAHILKPREYLSKINDFQLVMLYQPNNQFKGVLDDIKKTNKHVFVVSGSQTDWHFLNQNGLHFKHDISGQTEWYQPALNSNFSTFIVDDLDFESFPPLESAFGELTVDVPYETLLYKKLGNAVTEQSLLLTLEEDGQREVLLLGENIWQWRAESFLNTNDFQAFDNFIGKLVQYLASTQRKSRLVLDYESFYEDVSNVVVKAQYFNKNYEFDASESLQLTLTNKVDGTTVTLPFVLKNTNYQVDLSHLPASEYDFTVKALHANISKSGSLTILDFNIEQQFLNANVTKLQQLATNTNGMSAYVSDYTALKENLLKDQRYKPILKSTKITQALIDWKYLLGLLVLTLSAEWFLRKYYGLI
ncbi:VWA domain-containing protein [Formosa sp. A9]|uniref:VWA domain-containing protein n=1 Tax=Formosa sp. A9 TaxID=3442641 RepID=UPI003EBD62FB